MIHIQHGGIRTFVAATAAAMSFFAAGAAQATVITYNEPNGSYSGQLFNGTLTGGSFNGQTIASLSSNFMGADNGYLGFAKPNGAIEWYNTANGIGGTFSSAPNLSGGPLNGQATGNKSNYLGAGGAIAILTEQGVTYYVANGTAQGYYTNQGLSTYQATYSGVTTFTGGTLNGVNVARGVGLRDYGGNTDLNQGYLLAVAADGSLDHYAIQGGLGLVAAGTYYDFLLYGNYGVWKTFTGGALDGLTLSAVNANAIGAFNGNAYRYLGSAGDTLYFDIDVSTTPGGGGGGGGNQVPVPATLLLIAAGGCALLRMPFSRKKAY